MLLFFRYYVYSLHFPEPIIRGHHHYVNKEICHSDEGLWKVKAKYIVKEK